MKKPGVALAFLSLLIWSAVVLADGAATFQAKCKTCHGADAKGNPPLAGSLAGGDAGKLNLVDDATKALSADELKNTIKNGKGGKMPAFGSQLSDADIDEVVAYIKSLK